MTEHAYTDHTTIPPRQPAAPMARPLDRSRAVRLITDAYPIAEAAKLANETEVQLWLTDGEIGTWQQGIIYEGAPVFQSMAAWEEQGFQPTMFALLPAAPVDGVTV